MLSGEPSIVESAAALLKAVVTRNPMAMIRLYSTGAFYFSLAYPGSNLLSIAQLFSVTHVHQAFHGGEDAAVSSSLPLAKRSVLGGLLPESLLYVLERSGPGAFAAAMVSDSDTPEIIWTHKMRAENLIRQVIETFQAANLMCFVCLIYLKRILMNSNSFLSSRFCSILVTFPRNCHSTAIVCMSMLLCRQ